MDGSLWARIPHILICIDNCFGCFAAALKMYREKRSSCMHDTFMDLTQSNGLLLILNNLTDCNDVRTQSFLPLLPFSPTSALSSHIGAQRRIPAR